MAITPEHVTFQQIEAVCTQPIDALQLRAKELEAKSFYLLAKECRRITHERGILLIINDRLDIALQVGADGIHLPQNGLPIRGVKKFCPPHFLVGVSAHTCKEALKADREGASYITFSSKAKGKTPDLIDIQYLKNKISVPILALGGIQQEAIATFMNAGANGYAAMRMFFS